MHLSFSHTCYTPRPTHSSLYDHPCITHTAVIFISTETGCSYPNILCIIFRYHKTSITDTQNLRFQQLSRSIRVLGLMYRGADKSLARPGRKQHTTGVENRTPTVNRSQNRPARSNSLYWLSYPGPCRSVIRIVLGNWYLCDNITELALGEYFQQYRGADKSLARPGRKQATWPNS